MKKSKNEKKDSKVKNFLFAKEYDNTLAKVGAVVTNILLLAGIVLWGLSLVYKIDCGNVTKAQQFGIIGTICLIVGFGYKFYMKKVNVKDHEKVEIKVKKTK